MTCVLIAILSPYNYYEKLNYYHSNYYYYHYHHWIITALPGDVCPDRYFITKQLFESAYTYMIILFLSWQFLIGWIAQKCFLRLELGKWGQEIGKEREVRIRIKEELWESCDSNWEPLKKTKGITTNYSYECQSKKELRKRREMGKKIWGEGIWRVGSREIDSQPWIRADSRF